MVALREIPPEYRKTAERIPSDVLGQLSALDATARCVSAHRWHGVFLRNPDPVSARGAAALEDRVLTASVETKKDLWAKSAATSDPVLRAGYSQLAQERTEPSAEDIEAARRVLAQYSAQQVQTTVVRPRPARAGALTRTPKAAEIQREITRAVKAATAPLDARARELEREITAKRRQIAAAAAQEPAPVLKKDAPTMLYKAEGGAR
ncbi:hypothetical protein ORV05_26305 [Amycolatopsis cynarae]|uniref:Uncharacterized protein n=1 Tax=Amycolatopsis cynarae TaxID=2995223 RepID=A0ABY7AWS0_9PSEU|nr:hypothetical protein [Amycolatopsis sp. HUAS 11-8]WAL64459.1 hypothetical protein ORV05_26305 [Amycolatopsis sp. HUAS 11-8]